MFSWIRHSPRTALKCAAIAFVLLVIGAWRTWALMVAQPHPTVDYLFQLNEMVARDQPPGENAWPLYRRILEEDMGVGVETDEARMRRVAMKEAIENLHILEGAWDDTDRSADIAFIRRHIGLLERLDRAAATPVFAKPYLLHGKFGEAPGLMSVPPSLLEEVLLPAAGSIRQLGRFNTKSMRAFAMEGDWAQVEQRFETSLRMGNQYFRQRTLIEQIVAISIIQYALDETARLLDDDALPPEVLRALLECLEKVKWEGRGGLRRGVENELLIFRDANQRTHTKNGMALPSRWADPQAKGIYTDEIGVENVIAPWLPSMKRAEEDAALWFEQSKALLRLAPNERKEQAIVNWNSFMYMSLTLQFVAPAITRAIDIADATTSKLQALRIMLFLELHHAEAGEWPESLTDAITLEGATDPVSGELFVYQRTPQEIDGRAYTLLVPWLKPNDTRAFVNPPREALSTAAPVPYEVID